MDISIRSFKAEYCSLRIMSGFCAFFLCHQRRRKHLELKSAIVELGDGIADHHVGELANGLGNYRLRRINLGAS